ncbi:MAG: hypothetical protein JSW58_04565 [Candidatus Latescibacterota bacterium]|nr:MAG: hypothetical protein JSW58_04565 [Candidatus Latescibacterota bacterium]
MRKRLSTKNVLAMFAILIAFSTGACDNADVVGPEYESGTLVDGLKICLEPIRVGERFNVRITHSEWPGNEWQFRLPEYMIIHCVSGDLLRPAPLSKAPGQSVVLYGSRGGHDPAEYSIVMLARDDFIDVVATVTNTGSRHWNAGAFALACLVFGRAPAFHDGTLERTRAHFDGEFLDIKTARHRSGIHVEDLDVFRQSAHVLRAEDIGWRDEPAHSRRDTVDCSLIVRSSRYGSFQIAQAWEDAFSVSYNLEDPRLNCIHSNPRFGALEPGQSRIVRGRIYFVTGTIDALFGRFLKDFPHRGYEIESRGSANHYDPAEYQRGGRGS